MSCLLWCCTVRHDSILEGVLLLDIASCAGRRPPIQPHCSLLAGGGPRHAPGNCRLLTWQSMHCLQVVWPAKDNISSVHPLLPCSHALVSNCLLHAWNWCRPGGGGGGGGCNQQEPCLFLPLQAGNRWTCDQG